MAAIWNAFRHGLRDLGYLEGQNIAFDYRYAVRRPHEEKPRHKRGSSQSHETGNV